MPDCSDFNKGQIWYCDCGLELKVLKTCTTCSDDGSCGCSDEGHHHYHKHGEHEGCSFTCCGKPLKLKE